MDFNAEKNKTVGKKPEVLQKSLKVTTSAQVRDLPIAAGILLSVQQGQ